MGGSPGLVVMGGDSCSKGCEFESWYRILDEHFAQLFVVKIVMYVCKDWPICLKREMVVSSVTRLGDFLHFGQLFKAFGNN